MHDLYFVPDDPDGGDPMRPSEPIYSEGESLTDAKRQGWEEAACECGAFSVCGRCGNCVGVHCSCVDLGGEGGGA